MPQFGMLLYERYVPLTRSGTLEDAVKVALEEIYGGEIAYDDGDLPFEIIEIANITRHTTADHQDFFEKKNAAARKYQKEQQERQEREQFERLKKKFG